MTTGYVLILAMLVLGCAIATVGDQIGTKVGKARLSLFNLRPRKTATLVTVVTGGLISASTLAILLLLDQRLRTGLFQLEEIQQDLYSARRDLQDTQADKIRVESELAAARDRTVLVQERLDALNRSLEQVSQDLAEALEEQVATQRQLRETETELITTEEERRQAELEIRRIESQLLDTETQRQALESGIAQLQRQQRQLEAAAEQARRQLQARDRELEENRQRLMTQEGELARQEKERSQQAQELQRQELELAERETLLASLTQQQMALQEELQRIGQDFQLLRERRLAILQQQVLTSARVRVLDPTQVDEVVLQILQEANRVATQVLRPGTPETEEATLRIDSQEVSDLTERLADGEEYVVRVRSSRNYLLGEVLVRGFFEVLRNEVVFEADEVVAEVTVDLNDNLDEVGNRVYWLLEAARFQGEREGILPAQIQMIGGRPQEFRDFLERLLEQSGEVTIQAVAQELTYTTGPLFLNIKVLQNEEVLFELMVDGSSE
ncbi:MAG: DUF3084 domain-containing protein [Sodalinema sp.]|uniref:DUF3084 domain-containing protein n=1 Tax=Sodalinema sp. TaxID=3080550 RepID=UPI001203B96A|nr:MAG: DUF3084 domain-containing protein [Phormidium sp. SL48-SHIP]